MDLILATSKAGHDKGQLYVVLEEVNDCYLLANGTTKTVSKPKKKKKIHLQLIKKLPQEVIREIEKISQSQTKLDDLSIKNILKVYNRRDINV